jgi:hypothetical protein
VREQLLHRIGGIAGELEPVDESRRDDVALIRRRQRGRQQDERDEGGERLRREDQRPVDPLQVEERPEAPTGERRLQPADERPEPVECQRPAPPPQRTAYTPDSAAIRPDAIASSSDWWSRSF